MCELSNDAEHFCLCPLKGIIDTIGKKWPLLVVNAIENRGRLRFNQIMDELKGISPTSLADTLKELQREGLIKRESFAEIPPRVEYSELTCKYEHQHHESLQCFPFKMEVIYAN